MGDRRIKSLAEVVAAGLVKRFSEGKTEQMGSGNEAVRQTSLCRVWILGSLVLSVFVVCKIRSI